VAPCAQKASSFVVKVVPSVKHMPIGHHEHLAGAEPAHERLCTSDGRGEDVESLVVSTRERLPDRRARVVDGATTEPNPVLTEQHRRSDDTGRLSQTTTKNVLRASQHGDRVGVTIGGNRVKQVRYRPD